MLNTSLITSEMNNELCELERVNYMLMVTNKQYRACQNDGVSDRTRNYFDEKLQFLSEYYDTLVNKIRKEYSKRRIEDTQLINEQTEKFRNLFLQEYPECGSKFEDKFDKYGNSTYLPFQEDFYKFCSGEPTLRDDMLFYAYTNTPKRCIVRRKRSQRGAFWQTP